MNETLAVSTETPPICVYDTNLFLQAVLNPNGPAAQTLSFLEAGLIDLYISPYLRSEIEDVLYRPLLRAKYPRLTEERAVALLGRLDSFAQMVLNAPLYFALPRDRKDEPFINLAIHVGAKYLVSRDGDLLDLNHDVAFKQKYPSLTILDPVAFCAAMREWKSER